MTPRRTYTGFTHYRTPEGIFGGPPVTNARILAVQPVNLLAYPGHSPAVRLTLANNAGRGPAQLEAVEWGTPETWQPAPPEPANPIVTALTAAGIKAHPHQNRHGDVGAILHMVRKGRYCQLVIIERGTNLFWQILDRFGHEPAFYRWDNTRVADAPTRVRAHCRTFHARILPTRPVDAVPGQLLNP
ncbi:hypothetical protein [Kitasatospora cheerisanensis]|uniref:Uncharacterized protein n=1 Tax=Kitasatospora cheerisanensis KCTC 2395 TaxID=1348663 RepID=A0A066YWD5_9ACTN|nr:hypothetical protein [Kitasatospora cheerisanensis]KDN85858.1 hypothetical protein KCH_25160 [Kitasatospora cheerisanensis KCTC 2395]